MIFLKSIYYIKKNKKNDRLNKDYSIILWLLTNLICCFIKNSLPFLQFIKMIEIF